MRKNDELAVCEFFARTSNADNEIWFMEEADEFPFASLPPSTIITKVSPDTLGKLEGAHNVVMYDKVLTDSEQDIQFLEAVIGIAGGSDGPAAGADTLTIHQYRALPRQATWKLAHCKDHGAHQPQT